MRKKMRAAFVSAEISPFAGAGELGDFCSALPERLSALGVEISLFLPKYSTPEIEYLETVPVLTDLQVPLGPETTKAGVYQVKGEECSLYLIDHPKYFLRENIYGTETGDYLDNDERFIFFSRAVIEFLRLAASPPDIIHCQDWPTALIPVLLKTHYSGEPRLRNSATLLTLHDLSRQGEFPAESLALTGLNWNYFTPDQLSMNGRFNFLKAGIVFADVVNQAGPAEPPESHPGKHLPGLDELLNKRRLELAAIPNGRDDASWKAAAREYHKLYLQARQLKRGGSVVR
jgi:starch synthase